MHLDLVISCSAREIVSRGRLVSRCYRRLNAEPEFGHAAGELFCSRVIASRVPGGGMQYAVTLTPINDLLTPLKATPERSDFSCLREDWTSEATPAAEQMPQLSWSPSPSEDPQDA